MLTAAGCPPRLAAPALGLLGNPPVRGAGRILTCPEKKRLWESDEETTVLLGLIWICTTEDGRSTRRRGLGSFDEGRGGFETWLLRKT